MSKNKKIFFSIVLVFILALTLILLLHFLFSTSKNINNEEPEIINLEREYVFEDLENYIIEGSEEELIVKNKNIGLLFTAPPTWNIEKEEFNITNNNNEKVIIIKSPDYQESNDFYPREGCKIYFAAYTEESYYNHLKQKIESTLLDKNDTELVEVNEFFGVIYEVENKIIVRIPAKERIYEVGLYFLEEDSDCRNAYYSLINTILLDYD